MQIFEEIKKLEKSFSDPVKRMDGLFYKQSEKIKMVEFYTDSKLINGRGGENKDDLGRELPFYNRVNGMVETEKAAKDIDVANIQVVDETGKYYDRSYLLSKDLYEWMKRVGFWHILNDMNETHSRYGGVLVKKCYKEFDGKKTVYIDIPEWKNVKNHQVNVLKWVEEEHWMDASDLMEMEGVWFKGTVKKAIKLLKKSGKLEICVKEVRATLPRSVYAEAKGEGKYNPDDTNYSYQLHYVIEQSEGKELVLYAEEDTDKIYKYLARKKRSGRGLGVGVVEEGEQAQIWTNDAIQKKHRALELASKVVGQTASKNLKGRNLMVEVDDGQVLETEENKPLTTVSLLPSSGFQIFDNTVEQWFAQMEQALSAYDAQRGDTPPSGTPFRQQALVLQQSSSVFTTLAEELANFVAEIINDWIFPELIKDFNKAHILSHDFSVEELKVIDKNYSTHRANEEAKKKILSGQILTAEEYDGYLKLFEDQLKNTKSYRFLDIPDGYYPKDMKAKVTVLISNEQKNKAAMMESLYNIILLYSKNPMLAQDKVLSQLFMKLVELSGSGISPISIIAGMQEQAKEQQTTQQAPQPQPQPQSQMNPFSLQANPMKENVPTA